MDAQNQEKNQHQQQKSIKEVRIIELVEILRKRYYSPLPEVVNKLGGIMDILRKEKVAEEDIERVLEYIYDVYYTVYVRSNYSALLYYDTDLIPYAYHDKRGELILEFLRVCVGRSDPKEVLELVKSVLADVAEKAEVEVRDPCVWITAPLSAILQLQEEEDW